MREKSISVRVDVQRQELSGVTVAVIGMTRSYSGHREIARVASPQEFTPEELERAAFLAASLTKLAMTKLAFGTLLP